MGRPWLGQLLTYVSTVYGIGEKINLAKDEKKKPQIMAVEELRIQAVTLDTPLFSLLE
ncbi:hypothetical protein [Paenibacillus sp. GCM10027626]|uniref:hypothetical protein n=1 Tax=Paenibacillus sp. GCM10027626 TaxID=3273411 RepID=UPI00363438AB